MSQDTPDDNQDDMPELLAAADAAEQVSDADADAAMDSDSDADAQLELQNDSVAYFDEPRDSLYAIAQHPTQPGLVAVGGSAGPQDDAPGAGWVVDTTGGSGALQASWEIHGHLDSVTALAWTMPRGEALVSGGMDGRARLWRGAECVAEAHEVDEVTWLAACAAEQHPNLVALGASDGSVWIYKAEASSLDIVASYFIHTAPCTAGAWSADGALLVSVAQDSSLVVWDLGRAAAALVLDASDARFATDGLYAVALDPRGAFIATAGAAGAIRILSLPAGSLLAALHPCAESIESLSISALPSTTLLAAASVDGSITVFDASRNFSIRASFPLAHAPHAVVAIRFIPNDWLLTSCGMDGVLRRWDLRAATAPGAGLVKEWKGHRGGGDGGGVLAFVQGPKGDVIVTAGDDGLALVFKA
ncbi:hypothetical protein CDD82_6465 [Ophiocordyceps australis]|uniref:Uncharacterized protein n=1 Tax=Ophiocordyceps australis TaxID=1399860 RepID=A0A2C5ZJX2_9HYPO|nr:hypothetical protein CDD82_6465 [Ophiocordyceps australis]